MTKVSIIISEEVKDISLLVKKIASINTLSVKVQILLIVHQKLSAEELKLFNQLDHIETKVIEYPQDEDLLLSDLLKIVTGDELIPFATNMDYPADFLENIFQEETKELKNLNANNRLPYMERLLKAMQQSKYGLGVVKKDIKRAYPEFEASAAYQISLFTKLNILELEVEENLAQSLKKITKRLDIKSKTYSPNYKSIEYFSDTKSYFQAVRKEAPMLSFKNKPNAFGLPLYMMIFILLSLLLSPFFLIAVFPLLIMSALYLLAITLESLAISTIKKQGDLFPGLLVFFPYLHFYYLLSYFRRFFR